MKIILKQIKNLKEKNFFIIEDRLYLLFFVFSLILIFSLKIIFISLQNLNYGETIINKNFNKLRNDIVDRNGIILSRNITAFHAAIKPDLIKDKKIFSKIKLAIQR